MTKEEGGYVFITAYNSTSSSIVIGRHEISETEFSELIAFLEAKMPQSKK